MTKKSDRAESAGAKAEELKDKDLDRAQGGGPGTKGDKGYQTGGSSGDVAPVRGFQTGGSGHSEV